MSVPEINGQPIPIPDGFRFSSMSVHAESWEAWDALTEEDGWTERTFEDKDKGGSLTSKTLGPWPSGCVIAFAPLSPRPSERLATIYGITAQEADEMVRARRVPHALRRDLGGLALPDPIGYDIGEAQDALSWEHGRPTS